MLVAAVGCALTVAGVAWTVRSAKTWRESTVIQAGPRALATIASSGRVKGNHQEATLEYQDGAGRLHQVDLSFPLGLADHVVIGEATTVAYDRESPHKAELAHHPRQDWQGVAVAAALTVGVSLILFGLFAVLRRRARKGHEGAGTPPHGELRIDRVENWSAQHGSIGQHPLPRGAEAPLNRPPAPFRPASTGRGWVRATAAFLPLVVLVGGRIALIIVFEGKGVVFPPLPPPPVEGKPAALPEVLSARPPSSGPLVTPELARTVFEAAWRYRDDALARRDVASLRAIETGPALEVDIARIKTGGAPNRPKPSPDDLREARTYTPRQTTWPIRFLGEAVTTSAGVPFLEVMVFLRQGPTRPWQLTFDTGIGSSDRYTPALQPPIADSEGYNLVPEPTWIDPSDVVPALARYWQSWLERGSPPTTGPRFTPGTWTTQRGEKIAGRQGKRDLNGSRAHSVYVDTPTPDDQVWTFGVYTDMTLVCAPMLHVITWSGGTTQSPNQEKWGRDLAPGSYRTVTSERLREPCFLVPAQAGELGVFGADDWVIATRGEPA